VQLVEALAAHDWKDASDAQCIQTCFGLVAVLPEKEKFTTFIRLLERLKTVCLKVKLSASIQIANATVS